MEPPHGSRSLLPILFDTLDVETSLSRSRSVKTEGLLHALGVHAQMVDDALKVQPTPRERQWQERRTLAPKDTAVLAARWADRVAGQTGSEVAGARTLDLAVWQSWVVTSSSCHAAAMG